MHVLERDLDEVTRLEERSLGLRTHVALLAFMSTQAQPDQTPILLIDEAEMHLHYNAQADLIEALHAQDVAQHVIYSTHSVGCLPEDLGSAVRAVEPTGAQTSVIRQTPWVSGFGLNPLLAAMGAATFAFTPARSALVVEGLIDALLLPRLFREATGDPRATLGFQVEPGLSEVPKRLAEDLDAHAGTVLYLNDDDEGGRKHRRKVPKRARDDGRAFILGDGSQPGLCLEDLLDEQVLIKALGAVATANGQTLDPASLSAPSTGRGTWIDSVLAGLKLSVSRTLVAYALLDEDGPLLNPAGAHLLATLRGQLQAKLPRRH